MQRADREFLQIDIFSRQCTRDLLSCWRLPRRLYDAEAADWLIAAYGWLPDISVDLSSDSGGGA